VYDALNVLIASRVLRKSGKKVIYDDVRRPINSTKEKEILILETQVKKLKVQNDEKRILITSLFH
jgi:hypothetical protein